MRRLDRCHMGIRYYAYAFDSDRTADALADPRAFISGDPLADAWGFEPHARLAVATFEQSVPARDMLYLDKAWRELRWLTSSTQPSEPARPAYRMFEGQVAFSEDGWSWTPWVRALEPADVRLIAQDLGELTADVARDRLRRDGATARRMAMSTTCSTFSSGPGCSWSGLLGKAVA